eukprot:TRINITY_DN17671_c0_g1_i1.p1 TRINITY_DN17671_c0_g1~~TRINITY_DN17671_c0_g1_i1.p1  ORF type:complete len:533 (+),score=223.79 TRINITY_DN17671_c0_g1_i1:43-1641(+)
MSAPSQAAAQADVDFFGAKMVTNNAITPAEQFRQRYRRIKIAGKGSFGEAVLVRSREDGKRYIAKTIDCTTMSEKDKQDVYREIRILAEVNHPNIVRYKEHYEEANMLWIVMEYADGGDLGQRLKEQRKKQTETGMVYFEEQLIMMWFLQICMALKHLHDSHIIHRDVKTANIFLTSKNVVKLGDFGISTVLKDTTAVAYTVCGTPYYFSPEICQNKPYGSKSDVWALGIVLYEMATLRRPFNAKGLKELMKKIVTGTVDPIPSHYDPQLALLIGKLLTVHPTMRPSINRVLESSYVQDSLRAFSQELASQTERDKMIYDEKRKKRPERHAPAPAQPAPQPQPTQQPADPSHPELSFEDMKKMDRGALKKALAAHKDVAETEMAQREKSPKSGAYLGLASGSADDSDGDDAHVNAKVTMRGNIKEIIDRKGHLGDNNVHEPEDRDNTKPTSIVFKMPSGETVDRRDVRKYLEREVGIDALRQACDFLNAKLSGDDPNAVGDQQVQSQVIAILGKKKDYANVVSKLAIYEATT